MTLTDYFQLCINIYVCVDIADRLGTLICNSISRRFLKYHRDSIKSLESK